VVYLGGAYFGLYLAVDHVDDELVDEAGFDPLGNVYKSVTHDANFYLWNAAGAVKSPLWAGWEKKEGEPLDDFSDLDALTSWSANASDATFAAEVDSWISRGEFMDWFLLVHTLAADDSAGKNAYLYHAPGGLYRYAPWDFNHSVGQSWTTDRTSATSYNDFQWNNGIFAHLQNEPGLAAELWSRYDAMRADGAPLSLSAELDRLDTWTIETGDAAERDWGRWEADYRAYWSWRDDILDPAGETQYIREWLADRDVYLDTVH
nr:CotH kinase family protein [Deltaproteobacteria bacterium]